VSTLVSLSSTVEILEIISAIPLAAMEPKATSSRHAEERRDSPQSPEVRDPQAEHSRSSSADAVIPKTGTANTKVEPKPATMVGCWSPRSLNEEVLAAMEQEGLIAEKTISRWQVEPGAVMPAPLENEVVMLKSHVDRGLSLPTSRFLTSMLTYYKL
jgi:hypothetical protein